jgi:hypothetical protein
MPLVARWPVPPKSAVPPTLGLRPRRSFHGCSGSGPRSGL